MSSPSSRPPSGISTPEPLLGTSLAGRYRLERLLGRGGMGAVYEAVNHLGKHFAVKVILAEAGMASPEAKKRFVREARAASEIASEHVVGVVDADADPKTGIPFIVMDLLTGMDLGGLVHRVGPVEPRTAIRLTLQACRGLRAAHARSIVHRDIKPANIFLDTRESGEVIAKICDFGIAKTMSTDAMDQSSAGLTKTGGMLGSPVYMSPEQARNAKNVDARSDVWSLCVSLYEVLSGTRPWAHCSTIGELILGICTEDLRSLRAVAPWIDPALAAAVHKGLRRDLGARLQSIDALMEALAPFAEGSERVESSMLTGISAAQREAALLHRHEHGGDGDDVSGIAETVAAPGLGLASGQTLGLASTMGANAASVSKPPARRRSPLLASLAIAVVLGGGVGAWAFLRKTPRPATGEASATATPPNSATSVASSASPSTSASASTATSAMSGTGKHASVTVSPSSATVSVDGARRELVDGVLQLAGEPGDRFTIVATSGALRAERVVTILKGGIADPDRIVLAAAATAQIPMAPSGAPSVTIKKPAVTASATAAPSATGPTFKSTWP